MRTASTIDTVVRYKTWAGRPCTSFRPRPDASRCVTSGPMDNVAAQYNTASPLPVYTPSADTHSPAPQPWLAAKSPADPFSTPDTDPYASPAPYTPDHPYPAYPQSPSIRNDENMHPIAIPPSIGPTRITRRQARSTLHLGIRRDRPPHDSDEVRLLFFLPLSMLDPLTSPPTSCPPPVPSPAHRPPSAPQTLRATTSPQTAPTPSPPPAPCPSLLPATSRHPCPARPTRPSPSIPPTRDRRPPTPRPIRAPLLPHSVSLPRLRLFPQPRLLFLILRPLLHIRSRPHR